MVLGWSVAHVAGKTKTPTAGSEKCEKGLFVSLVKDPTIPLCDAHYPDAKAKSGWLVLFYKKEEDTLHELMNRVAMDLGNEPPEKSKALKNPKKQRIRIKDLAEKYNFEANIPKKGLEDKGKEPLLKVGAVCCNCGEAGEQNLCETRESGIWLVRPGEEEKMMPGGEEKTKCQACSEHIVKFALGELVYVKVQEADTAAGAAGKTQKLEEKTPPEEKTKKKTEEKGAEKRDDPEDVLKKMDELKEKKKKAIADEDFTLAGKLKKDIAELEEKIKEGKLKKNMAELEEKIKEADGAGEDTKDLLKKKIEELKEKRKKAQADEDFELDVELKKEINDIMVLGEKSRKPEL